MISPLLITSTPAFLSPLPGSLSPCGQLLRGPQLTLPRAISVLCLAWHLAHLANPV